ncbi:MAG: hypothetical protein KDD53_05175, partial [Bdellovibrionales bacterium]|nr:hypothetical protein [Bdellovibrionales bacterium]
GLLSFELSPETLRRTHFSSVKVNSRVNLERALAIDDRIHGHFVSGHVDGTVELLLREVEGAGERFLFSRPESLSQFIVEKGCVSINGVSLTVGEVGSKDFAVYLISHTLTHTTLKDLNVGDLANIEVDLLARYIQSIYLRQHNE